MKLNTRKALIALSVLGLTSHAHAELTTTAVATASGTALKTTTLGALVKAGTLLKTGAATIGSACQAHPAVAVTTGVVTLTIVCFKWYNQPVPLNTDPTQYKFASFAPVDHIPKNGHVVPYDYVMRMMKDPKPGWPLYVKTKDNRTIEVNCGLPKDETRPIHVKFVPLVCCFDARTHDRGVYDAFKAQEQEIVKDAVTTSYMLPTYDHRSFDFGGQQTQQLMSNILNKIAHNNPKAPIVVEGVCASATGAINTLANPELAQAAKPQIVAASLESPAISSDDTWQHMGENEIPWPLNKLLGPIMAPAAGQYFPSCTPQGSNEKILQTYKNIPPHIKMFIARKKTDKTVSSKSIDAIVEKVQAQGNDVQIHEDSNPKFVHGHMVKDPAYRQATANFFAHLFLDRLGA